MPSGFGFPVDIDCPARGVCLAVGGSFLFLGNSRPSASITRDGGATRTAIPFSDIPLDVLNAGVGALSCSATRCLAQLTRSDRTVPSNVTFSTTDGWATLTVTGQ